MLTNSGELGAILVDRERRVRRCESLRVKDDIIVYGYADKEFSDVVMLVYDA